MADEEKEEERTRLAQLQQQLQLLILQRQQLILQNEEISAAIEELGKAKGEVYRAVGPILLQSSKEEVLKDLQERSSELSSKIEMIARQEERLRKSLEEMLKERRK